MFYADGSHKINEKSSFQHIGSQSVAFEVDMVGFRTKFMTYRATLRQVQVSVFFLKNGACFFNYIIIIALVSGSVFIEFTNETVA